MGADLVCPCPPSYSNKVSAEELPTKYMGQIRFVESMTSEVPPLVMSSEEKDCLVKHFRATMMEQKPDIFHKVMLQCMTSSPKINEIIACQMYCYRDLTKWPKLNSLCQAQLNFYDRLINVLKLDETALCEAVYSLGLVHYRYARYGLKPHFLDLWHQHMEQLVKKLKFKNKSEKDQFEIAFGTLNTYVTSTMNLAYSRCQMQHKLQSRADTVSDGTDE